MDFSNRKIGLALSGGGYRAAAYHIGTLRALRRLGVLDKVDIISSVSGGSITSAYYALNKENHAGFERNLIMKLQQGVMSHVWLLLAGIILGDVLFSTLMGSLISYCFGSTGLFFGVSLITFVSCAVYVFLQWYNLMPISDMIGKEFDKVFFRNKTLADLPSVPLLTINATNMATNLPFNFSKDYMGEFAYTVGNESIFDAGQFPISQAVMASSCVPYGFTPIKIDKRFLLRDYSECDNNPGPPLLIDGGIYDNQGAHKLSVAKSRFHSDLIIVSDAGNGEIRAEKATNFISTLIKASNMMMERIKNLQISQNIYEGFPNHSHYAYIPLKWDCNERLIDGFIRNLKEGNVHTDVWRWHGISDADIADLKDKDSSSYATIAAKLKSSIGWADLVHEVPAEEAESIAKSVGTNLTALAPDQIHALIAHAEWMTLVQIKLYLPFIIDGNRTRNNV